MGVVSKKDVGDRSTLFRAALKRFKLAIKLATLYTKSKSFREQEHGKLYIRERKADHKCEEGLCNTCLIFNDWLHLDVRSELT